MAGSAGAGLRQLARRAEAFPRKFVKSAVSDLRKEQTKKLKMDTGGDAAMSGIGNAKLKIKTSVKGDTTVTGSVSAGKPRGPWTWLEEGTKPHSAGGKFRGARHPGTKPGKRTWSRSVPRMMDGVVKKARDELRAIVQGR